MRIVTIPSALTLLLLSACAFDPQPTTDEDVIGQLVECQTGIEELQQEVAELGGLRAAVEAIQASDAVQDGRLDAHDEEIAQSVLLLTSSTTVTVSDAEGLLAALDTLDRYRLAREVTYTIELEDGTYTFAEPLNIRHPDGAALQIIGNVDSPEAVTLDFAEVTDGVVIDNGRALGLLSGVTVSGRGPSDFETGIFVSNGGTLTLGDSIVVKNFYYGVRAERGATIDDDVADQTKGWLTVKGCVRCIYAEGASQISVPYAVTYPTDGSGGFMATNSSSILADYAVVEGGYQGFIVTNSSSMVAEYATATMQTDVGFSAGGVSYFNAVGSSATETRIGLQIGSYSYFDLQAGTLEGSSYSILQGYMGAANVTGGEIPNGIANSNNDLTDFVIGN